MKTKKGNYCYLIEEICQNFRTVSTIGVVILFTLPFYLMHQEQDIVTIYQLCKLYISFIGTDNTVHEDP